MKDIEKSAPAGAGVKYPRRDARKRQTRERILRAAQTLFQAKGYDEVKMADIAEAADVHITTLFIHFGAKRDLADALADEQLKWLTDRVEAARGRIPFFTFFRQLVADWVAGVRHGDNDQVRYSRDVRTNPELTISWLGQHRREIVLYARYFAADHGLDADRDMLPHMVANMLSGANVVAHDRWMKSEGRSDLLAEALAAVDLCEAMVAAVRGR